MSKTTLPMAINFVTLGQTRLGPGCRELKRETDLERRPLKKKKKNEKEGEGEARSAARIPDSIIRGRRKDRARDPLSDR